MKKLLLVAGVLASAVVSAEEAKEDAVVHVVVYASRCEDSAEDMPASVSVFYADDIALSGARDLPELLDKAANLQLRTLNANPLQSHVALRGFGENSFGRVKIFVDGEEINSVDMESPNLARIPIGNISRVEVIRGASPVLYGDGATAGVINITTDTRDYAKKTRLSAKIGSYGTVGLNAQTKGGFVEDGYVYSAYADYTRSDGYRSRTGYDLYSAGGTIRRNFENGSTLALKANYFNALYEMPGSLDYATWQRDPRHANSEHDWCRLWNYGFSFDSKANIADDQWLYLDAAFSVKHRHAVWGDYGYANDYDLYGWQLSPRYVNEKAIFDFDNKFIAGFEFKYDRYNVRDRSGWNNPKYHFDRSRYAVFARDEFFLSEKLSLIAGARCERIGNKWTNYSGLKDDDSVDWEGDFELGLVYRPLDGLKTYVKGTRYHRSAFCDELNYTEDGKFLSPERGTTLDLGLEYVFAEEFTFDAEGYWSLIDDEIFYNPYVTDYGWGYWGGYNSNAEGRTERLGFDASLTWKRDHVAEASIRESFVQASFKDGQYKGKTVPLVPQNRLRVEIGVWLWDELEVKGGYRFVSRQTLAGDFRNEHEKLESYSLFDIGVYYTPTYFEGWKASFVMDNLLDEKYCDFAGWSDYSGAYYYPGCGRSFLFTMSYEF